MWNRGCGLERFCGAEAAQQHLVSVGAGLVTAGAGPRPAHPLTALAQVLKNCSCGRCQQAPGNRSAGFVCTLKREGIH